jgi:hypothetical protein
MQGVRRDRDRLIAPDLAQRSFVDRGANGSGNRGAGALEDPFPVLQVLSVRIRSSVDDVQ